MTEHSIRRRCRPDQWDLIKEAADHQGESVGDFALRICLREARNVIAEKLDFEQLRLNSNRQAS